MAGATKKRTTRSAKSKTPAKQSAGKGGKAASSSGLKKQVAALVLIAFGVITLLGLFMNGGGTFVLFLLKVLKGLFGGSMYVLPITLVYAGVLLAVYSMKKAPRLKLWAAFVLQVTVAAFVQLFNEPMDADSFLGLCSKLYQNGSHGGGLIGGLPAHGLRVSCGLPISFVILSFLALLCFVVLLDITLQSVASTCFPSRTDREEMADDGFEEDEDKIPVPAVFSSKGSKNFKIDIPVDEPSEPAAVPEKKKVLKSIFDPEIAESKSDAVGDIFEIAAQTKPKMTREELSGAKAEVEKEITKNTEKKDYIFPTTALLSKPASGSADSADELRANAAKIVDTLRSFGVETKVINVSRGPAVTRYELSPSVGVKISRITSLSDDIALALASVGVRIEAPIPGKAAVGIEVPNKNINTVYIRSLLESSSWAKVSDAKKGAPLAFVLGKDLGGADIIGDIAKMPHMLVAGATGSGKSVCINSIIVSLLFNSSPDDVRMIMVDPKMVELAVYNGIPHLLIPVVTDPKKAAGALAWALSEMEKRYQLFYEKSVRDIDGYNQVASVDEETEKLPHIVIIIDELADLMMTSPKEVEDSICRLAQKARAAGMHLVIATQRPSVDVITGIIKANIPSRIAFAVSSMVDSRTILDMGGAEKLLGRGDMLYYPLGAAKPVRIQGCFVSNNEVESVVSFVKKNAIADYDQSVIESIETAAARTGKGDSAISGDGDDEMLPVAIEFVVESGMASTSMLQRRLKLGYARASRLIDEMELRGIVGPFEGSKPRQVKISKLQWQEMMMRKNDEQD